MGTTDIIKIRTKYQTQDKNHSSFIESKFIEACEKLDASIFEPLIEEYQYFEELDKYRFLQSLKDVFEGTISRGITKTFVVKGDCGLCHPGHETLNFMGKQKEFAYLIQKEDGHIIDIFRCNLSGIKDYAERFDLKPLPKFVSFK